MSDEFNDEHSGKGGSYVIDADGKRVLQERTDVAASTISGQAASTSSGQAAQQAEQAPLRQAQDRPFEPTKPKSKGVSNA